MSNILVDFRPGQFWPNPNGRACPSPYIYNNIYYNILFKNKKNPKKISRGILKYL
jgi:hypothetical protein